MSTRLSIAKILAKSVVTFALLGYLVSRSDIDQFIPRMSGVGAGALLIGSLMISAISVPAALRWKLVLSHLGHDLRSSRLWLLVIIGMFFNQFLPTGIGGDVTRVWYLHRDGVSMGASVTSILLDRVIGVVALLGIVAAGAPYLGNAGINISMSSMISIGALFGLGLALVIFADRWFSPILGLESLSRSVRKIPHGERMVRGLLRVSTMTREFIVSWPGGVMALGLSTANFIIASTAAYLLARALGATVDFYILVFLLPAVLLFGMLPVSLGGWGVREGAMVLLFGLVGTSHEDALGISILFGICSALSGLPGAAAWLLLTHGGRNSRPEIK